ncbi:Hypothetical protein D9617_7g031890 [Elsinoe fawcettii]|nr:Hypothetical protein D9617_7g031890 [Elsinoe fawcettii]
MSDSDDSDASSSPPPQTLIAGRAKRVTAGNRLSHLLQHLEDEDVKADLLADEQDDQKDYSASEGDDADVAFESSDDSEDEGKEGEDDELAGEKEIKKQERVESKRKRKARELVRVQPKKKKVKIADDVTMSGSDAPIPQPKKAERPAPSLLGPLRQSSRTQTIANAKITEAKIKESKKRAKRTQEIMRIAAEKKAAEAGPELTQADRMARALATEKVNNRSLNRWEKSEQERLRLQKEKLEAMRNRKLEGPLIRYWSGPVQWTWREGPEGPVYARFKYLIDPEEKVKKLEKHDADRSNGDGKQSRRQSLAKGQAMDEAPIIGINGEGTTSDRTGDTAMSDAAPTQSAPASANPQPPDTDNGRTATGLEANDPESSFLDGIQLYASDDDPNRRSEGPKPSILVSSADAPSLMEPYSFPALGYHPSMPPYTHIPTSASHGSHLPLHTELASRVLLTLSQFPTLPSSPPPTRKALTSDPVLTSHLLPDAHPSLSAEEKRYLTTRARSSKNNLDVLPAPPARPTCAITGRQAKFRDPKTRLPYADMPAHKAIQRVLANGCAYSPLLGAWAGIVGEGTLGRTARGVPAGWWTGTVGEREVIEL